MIDQIGQLVVDKQEDIEAINWRVDGKISSVIRDNASAKKELSFVYDAMGNRVAKKVYDATGDWESTTYYIRDAQGNVMSVYENTTEGETSLLSLEEQHIYGSSRLGMRLPGRIEMIGAEDPVDTLIIEVDRGNKRYELTNHLGNVLTVISDQKMATEDSGDIDYYSAEVLSYSDYYPFGSPMTERTWNSSDDYRYGFNGKEGDDEGMGGGLSTYDYGFRIYNSSMGKFLSVDPLTKTFPWYTPYQFAGNDPVSKVDLDGLEEFRTTKGQLIYRASDNGVVFTIEDDVELLRNLYPDLEKAGENYAFDLGEIQDGELNESSFEYEKLMMFSRHTTVGNEIVSMFMKNPKIEQKEGVPEQCSPCSFRRTKIAYDNIMGPNAFPTTGHPMYGVWNLYDRKNLDAITTGTEPKVPDDYMRTGASGALEWMGMGRRILSDEIWAGGLMPGAILGLKSASSGTGHSVIFLGYRYNESGEISGLNYWDQHSHTDENGKLREYEILERDGGDYQPRAGTNINAEKESE